MKSRIRIHYGWIILAAAVATVLGSLGFGRFGYTVILPAMKSGLGLSEARAGDLATANMIGYLALAITCGFLSSKYSPRAIISVFMLILAAGMLMTGLAPDYKTAFAGRLITGMGSGGTNIPVMAIVISWFGTSKRGLASGIAVSGSSFGLLITGIAVPAIINSGGADGWRYSWYALSGAAVLIALSCALILRNSPRDMGMGPVGGAGGEAPCKTAIPLRESWRLVSRSFTVWHLAFIYILFGFSYIIYATFFVRYLNWECGLSLANAGKLWSVTGAVSIASGFMWGGISDRIGRKYGLFFVFFIQAVSFAVFGLWKSTPGFLFSALLFSVTAWSVPAIMAAASGDLLGPRAGSAALGFITLFFGIGQAAGPFFAGRIAELCGSYTPAFVTASGAAFTGALLSLLLRPPGSRQEISAL